MAGLLDLIDCRIGSLLEKNMGHFSPEMTCKHLLDDSERLLLLTIIAATILGEYLLLRWHEEASLRNCNFDQLE